MTTTSLGRVSPEELLHEATVLRTHGRSLLALAARTQLARPGLEQWSGLAALEQAAQVQLLDRVLRRSAGPGEDAARVLEQCADVARVLTWRVRLQERLREEILDEIRTLQLAGPPGDPVLIEVWRRRLQELEQAVERARGLIRQAEGEWEECQEHAARMLQGVRETVDEIVALVPALKGASRLAGGVRGLARSTAIVVRRAQVRWTRNPVVRTKALERAGKHLRKLVPFTGSKSDVLKPGVIGLVSAWRHAVIDVRTGGGYQGWRGVVTRISAGGAVVGGVVAPIPKVGAVGVTVLKAYQAWVGGNIVYDERHKLAPIVRLVKREAISRGVGIGLRARARAQELMEQLREAGEDARRWRPPVIGLPKEALSSSSAVEAIKEAVEKLPGVGSIRDRLRETGIPIRLPSTPLGPVLRAPVELGRSWGNRAAVVAP